MKNVGLTHPLMPYLGQIPAIIDRMVTAANQRLNSLFEQKPYRIDPDSVSEISGDRTTLATSFIAWRLPTPTAPALPPVIDQSEAVFNPGAMYAAGGVAAEMACNIFDVDAGHLGHV